ncbi:MAG: hypothetical protein ACQEQ4_11375, partial [Fibrobacterota bacterium]
MKSIILLIILYTISMGETLLGEIYFDADSARLSAQAQENIDTLSSRALSITQDNDSLGIHLTGYTFDTADSEFTALSQKRIENISEKLRENG